MADTLFFAVMSFYGWSVGSGLDRSGNVTMAANSPEGSRPLPTSRVGDLPMDKEGTLLMYEEEMTESEAAGL